MTRLSGLLDPQSAAIVGAAYDAATSPRRRGPRFVDTEAQAAADAIAADPRTTGQIAIDTFVDLVRIGSEVDPDRFAGCDRPVSWCESHHIVPVSKGGRTDIDDGILLCRHHHMLTHDNGWRIERDPTHGFVAIPPRTEDPRQQPVPLPSRSRALARLRT